MPDTAKRVSGPALLTAAAATVYTVPTSTTTVLRSIHVSNVTANAVGFTLSIGTWVSGGSKDLYTALLIPANGSLDWSGFIVMAAAEIMQGFGSVTNALALTVSAVETT